MGIKRRIIELAEEYKDDMMNFLMDMISIPSISGDEEKAALRIKKEMEKVGFDEVFVEKLGNVIGRIGSGEKIIAFDAHIDTADVGDRELWQIEPFEGFIKDDIVYGRGTADQKGAIASIVYAGKIIKELDLEDNYTLYVTGTVMKEECNGLAWQYLLDEEVITPDYVVITEPTNLNIYRGNRGQVQLKLTTKGLSCDASAPQRGLNAVYMSVPIIQEIEELNKCYKENNLLGKSSIAVTQINYKSPSKASIPEECTIGIDRRLTIGESIKGIVKEIESLKNTENSVIQIDEYAKPSYTGIV